MPCIIELDDDGMLPVRVTRADGEKIEANLDLYEANDKFVHLSHKYASEPDAFVTAAREYLNGVGLTGLTRYTMFKLIEAVYARTAEAQKADAERRAAAGTT